MPDGSPLQPEMFQFTNEEVSLVPGILDQLIPPHLKGQNHTYVSSTVQLVPSSANLQAQSNLPIETQDVVSGAANKA